MKKTLTALCAGAALLYGCVVAPPPQRVVYPRPAPPPAEPVVDEYDYVGDTTPIEVVEYPEVIFYPRYVIACNCIVPVGFHNGIWIDRYGKTVVYEGVWHRPPVIVINRYHEHVRLYPHLYRRMPVERVTIIRGRTHPPHVPTVQPRAPVTQPHVPAVPHKEPAPKPPSMKEPPMKQPAATTAKQPPMKQPQPGSAAPMKEPAKQPQAAPPKPPPKPAKKKCPGEQDPNKKEC